MRLDQWLLLNQLVKSRTQAQAIIARGELQIWNPQLQVWLQPSKASLKVSKDLQPKDVRIQSDLLRFVSRAGLKLFPALEQMSLEVQDQVCLDVGQSTGGFSDCLLKQGAKTVIGVEVGHSQLAQELKHDSRLLSFENLDIREAQNNLDFIKYMPADLAVIDVSFISLRHVLKPTLSHVKPKGRVLALVKPQFELSAKDLDRRGLVKSKEKLSLVKTQISDYVKKDLPVKIIDYFQSSVKGKDGNIEFFMFIQKNS